MLFQGLIMIDFGEILRHVGELGLFQKLLLLALSFPNVILSLNYGSLLFVESDPERHCNTDWILGAGSNLTEEEQLHLTIPREPDGSLSRCLMFSPVNWTLDSIRRYGLNHTTACRDGWVYDRTQYQATIVTDVSCAIKSNEGIWISNVNVLGIVTLGLVPHKIATHPNSSFF